MGNDLGHQMGFRQEYYPAQREDPHAKRPTHGTSRMTASGRNATPLASTDEQDDSMDSILEEFTRTLSDISPCSSTGQSDPLISTRRRTAALGPPNSVLSNRHHSSSRRNEGLEFRGLVSDAEAEAEEEEYNREGGGGRRRRDRHAHSLSPVSHSKPGARGSARRHTPLVMQEMCFDSQLAELVDELESQSPTQLKPKQPGGGLAKYRSAGRDTGAALAEAAARDEQVCSLENWREWGRNVQDKVVERAGGKQRGNSSTADEDESPISSSSLYSSRRSGKSSSSKQPGWWPRHESEVQENDWVSTILD